MSVVWEDPPKFEGRGAHLIGSQRATTPEGKEANEIREQLKTRPNQWARLWDYGDDKEAAVKKANFMGRKGYNYSVRSTPERGYSLYGRYVGVDDKGKTVRPGVTEPVEEQAPAVREPAFPE